MAPSAPGLLSTTKRWPRLVSTPGDIVRNIASETLPAANGMTTRMGLLGQSWARPAAGGSASSPTLKSAKICLTIGFYIGKTDVRQQVRRSVRVHGKHLPLPHGRGDLQKTGCRRGHGGSGDGRFGRHAWLPCRRTAGSSITKGGGEARLRSQRPASAHDRGCGFSALRPDPADGPGALRDSLAYCRGSSRPQAEIDDVLRAALQGAGSAGPLLRRASGVRARARYARGRRRGLARVPAKGLSLPYGLKSSEPAVRPRFQPEPKDRLDPREAVGARAWPERISAPTPLQNRLWRPSASAPAPARSP